MIDKRTREWIDYYIPNPPDPDLPKGAYYYLQYTMGKPRILTVYPLDILPGHDRTESYTEYGIYQQKGNRLVRIDSGYCDPCRGVRMHDLYDNKQDCRDQTHNCFDGWESLRELQKKEMEGQT